MPKFCGICGAEVGRDDDECIYGHAQASAPLKTGWQPIETSPANSDDVLTWDGNDQAVLFKSRFTGEWTDGDHKRGIVYNPTHWMPLPKPPQE